MVSPLLPTLPPAPLSLDLFTLDLLLLFLQITLEIPLWSTRRSAVLLDVSVAEDRASPLGLDRISRPFDLSGSKSGSKLFNGLLSRLPVLSSLIQPHSSRGTSRMAKKRVLSSGTPFLVPLPRGPSAPSSLPVSPTLFSQAATLILTSSSLLPKVSPPVRPFSLSSATDALQESSLPLPHEQVLAPGPLTLPYLTNEVLTSCALP